MTAPDIIKRNSILVVTADEKLAAGIFSAMGKGFSITRAASAPEALSIMAFNMQGLVISDADLPKKGCMELLRNIRKGSRTKLVPYIALMPESDTSMRLEAIKNGADACLQKPFVPAELKALALARINTYRELYILSITDELTRLFNRKELIKKFNEDVANDQYKTISLAILDVDFFKKVNDLHGHQTGDRVLKKLADLMRRKTSDSFFPSRFGGEEFVILFPGQEAEKAKEEMEHMLLDFSLEAFETETAIFNVTFSGGIAEYPSMASNISELLSRADQALYSAKADGRKRVYIFTPVMERNDKFWGYLKSSRGIFVDNRGFNAVTKLPYLPQLFEIVTTLEFEMKSLGVLFIRILPLYDIEGLFGSKNLLYDIENTSLIITRSAEMVFPTDLYAGHSNIFSWEFVVLFPSIIDFSAHKGKFEDICDEICSTIQFGLSDFSMDMACSSGIVKYERSNPQSLYRELSEIRNVEEIFHDKTKNFQDCLSALNHVIKDGFDVRRYIKINTCYDTISLEPVYCFPAIKEEYGRVSLFSALLEKSSMDIATFKEFLSLLFSEFRELSERPLLLSWITDIDFLQFCEAVKELSEGRDVVILINESRLPEMAERYLKDIDFLLPDNVRVGIDNCFIGNDILGYLSLYDFSVLVFSESITRKIHHFKERITIIRGLTVFLDQVSIPAIARNIQLEEEFQVIKDLQISYAEGRHMDLIGKKEQAGGFTRVQAVID